MAGSDDDQRFPGRDDGFLDMRLIEQIGYKGSDFCLPLLGIAVAFLLALERVGRHK